MADNILEAVLSKDIDKRFEAIDKRLESIEKHTENTVKALGGLGATLVNEFGTMSKGLDDLTGGINRLTVALSKMGSVGTSSAGQTASNIVNAAAQLNRLYNERLQYESKIAQLEKGKTVTAIKGESPTPYMKAIDAYREQIKRVQAEIDKLAATHHQAAADAKALYDTKSAGNQLRQMELYNAAVKRTKDEIERLRKAEEKRNQKDFNATLGVSTAPQTIEQYRIAIRNLKAEIEKLNPSNREGIARLNMQIKQYERELEKAGVAQKKFNDQTNKLGLSLRNLASAFGVVFSVRSLVNFGEKVVQITGEFEMQHRAMQAIIGDMDAANKLWDKTIALAVKSPYRVKDLVSYTKQLAAYRIETDKLYDTTKMLADISAGLGVDMQRLILAYGQVKAANYLRGQELRQFSEAGVNILGELANYFSELQGKAISTGEVFDMVSKRMVKFEDVATVLHRLTEEGGIFFNMQEIQAETLQGKIMNLRDSFDIMLNSMGESNKGTIVWLVDTAKKLIDNWEKVTIVIKSMVRLFALFKIAQIAAAANMVKLGTASDVAAMGLGRVSTAIVRFIAGEKAATAETMTLKKALGNLGAGGWVTLAIAAFVAIYRSISDASEAANRLQTDLNKIQDESLYESRKMADQYESMAKKVSDVNTSESERVKILTQMKNAYGQILPERLLNVEYLKKEGNAYTEAKSAIEEYYDMQRRERQAQRIEDKYADDIADARTDFVSQLGIALREYNVGVSDLAINAALDELIKKLKEGTIAAKDLDEEFMKLLKRETGLDIRNSGLFDKKGLFYEGDFLDQAEQYIDAKGKRTLSLSERLLMFVGEFAEMEDEIRKTIEGGRSSSDYIMREFKEFINTANEIYIDTNLGRDGFDDNYYSFLVAREKSYKEYLRRLLDDFKETHKEIIANDEEYFDNQFEIIINTEVNKTSLSIAEKRIAGTLTKLSKQFDVPIEKEIFVNLVYDDNVQGLEQYYNEVKKYIETQRLLFREAEAGLTNFTEKQIESLKKKMPFFDAFEKILDGIYGKSKNNSDGGNKALELLNKQIEAIKNASKQYEEYQKLYDDTTAFDKTKNAVQDLFGQLGIGGLLNKEGIFDKMTIQDQLKTWLSGQMAKAGKDGRIAIEKYIRELELQASQADFKKIVEAFEKNMDEAFTDYDMFKELQKLGIGGDISEQVFGVTTKSMTQLKASLAKQKQMLLDTYAGTEAIEAIEKVEKKITDLENKETVERLKKYTDYLIKGRDEAVKIHLDQLTKMAELDELYAKGYYTKTQYQSISDKIEKETKQALAKNDWQTFKESDFYTTMFEDLANVADSSMKLMLERLHQMKGKLSDLDPTQVKEVVKAIERLEEEGRKRSPIKAWLDDIKKLQNWDKKGNENKLLFYSPLQKYLKDEQEFLAQKVAEEQALYDRISADEEEGNESETKQRLEEYEAQLKDINDQLEKVEKNLGIITKEENDGEAAFRRVWEGVAKGAEYFNQAAEAAGQVSTEIMGMMDGIDDASKQLAEDIADFAGNTAMLVKDIAAIIASEGSDVSAWIDAVLKIINLFKSGISINEWDINSTIESNTKKLEELEWTYSRVQRASERAWDTTNIQQSHRELNGIIQDQINAYNKMIDAEEARKNPDQDQITDWKRAIKEMYETMEDEAEAFYERVGGIGAGNYGDAAQGFVDAWMDAFKETGDGLEGLQDKFAEIIENLVKKQAMQRLAKTLMSGLFEMIDEAAKNGIVTQAELDEINQFAEVNLPQWNEALKNFAQSLGFLGDQAEGELDGLQKGIQGVTEQTAEIIAAYMNAIRYYVIDNNTKLGQIVGIVQDNTGAANPMLAELRSLRQRADDIHYLLNGWRETSGIDSMRVTIVN